jgi:hypothetical protein
MPSYSIEYLDNTMRVIEVNSGYLSRLESEVKPLEKDKLAKLYNYKYIRDYVTFSKTHALLSNKVTLLDLLDDSYLK